MVTGHALQLGKIIVHADVLPGNQVRIQLKTAPDDLNFIFMGKLFQGSFKFPLSYITKRTSYVRPNIDLHKHFIFKFHLFYMCCCDVVLFYSLNSFGYSTVPLTPLSPPSVSSIAIQFSFGTSKGNLMPKSAACL